MCLFLSVNPTPLSFISISPALIPFPPDTLSMKSLEIFLSGQINDKVNNSPKQTSPVSLTFKSKCTLNNFKKLCVSCFCAHPEWLRQTCTTSLDVRFITYGYFFTNRDLHYRSKSRINSMWGTQDSRDNINKLAFLLTVDQKRAVKVTLAAAILGTPYVDYIFFIKVRARWSLVF